MSNGWEKVGEIGVDGGLCWLGDPCYILHTEKGLPQTLGANWQEFCNTIRDMDKAKSFHFALGHEGLGVVVSTGHGDGRYPVCIQVEHGKVKAVKVEFF